uniref:Uncharacterized protein n=1 Tax=Arundo donax TaxID=35708 RepID=A0A0A9B8Y2_ARUDO
MGNINYLDSEVQAQVLECICIQSFTSAFTITRPIGGS